MTKLALLGIGVACLVPGCGRIGFDVRADSVDGTRIGPFGPFGTPTILSSLSTSAREYAVSVSSDELEIYFVSDRSATYENYRSTRPTADVDFGPPMLELYGTQTTPNEPALSRSGVEMYLQAQYTQRVDRNASWAMPVPASGFNGLVGQDFGAHDTHMVMSDDLDTMLYEMKRSDLSSPWSSPTQLAEFQGVSSFMGYPAMTDDGLEIFFEAHVDAGRSTILHAVRVALDQPFGQTSEVLALPTTVSSGDPAISGDGAALYFESDLNSPGSGAQDLFVAKRQRL